MRATPYHRSKHLEDGELLPATGVCPVCGASGRLPVARLQRDPDVALLQCGGCGLASASRMPTDAALQSYYARYYRGAAEAAAVTFDDPERFGRMIARLVPPAAPRRVHLLDFGGGDGALAVAAAHALRRAGRATGASVVVVDDAAPPPARSSAVSVTLLPTLSEATGPFDLVLASAVLEHIPDVGAALRALCARLAVGGCLYARTPYWAPFARVVPRVDFTFPGHVHDLGPRFWNRAATTLGLPLEVVASRPSIIETSLRRHPLRTVAAALFKLPARLEVAAAAPGTRDPRWTFVGGWEVLLRRR